MMTLTMALAACTSAPPVPRERPNLVLVTLDTTRVDRIGAYGYPVGTTPAIDALAAQGARFERAYATVPLTTPSHATILSGLYPTRHGVHTNGDALLPDSVTTLAEVLSGEGYATGAAVSAFVTTGIWNFDQGFDTFDDRVGTGSKTRWGRERPAPATVDAAVAFVRARTDGRPFFLWVHLYDPHDPHAAPEPYASRFADPYDAEIAWADAEVGRLRGEVEAVEGGGGTAWIVTADHGEAFDDEHGENSHGLFLFDPTMRVPFVVRPPAPLGTPHVVSGVAVSGADVMPTALGLLGITVPPGLDGVDLSAAVGGGTAPERAPVYMESYTVEQRLGYHPELAMAERSWKWMGAPDARLYDLAADPHETVDVDAAHPDVVDRLRNALTEVEAARSTVGASAADPEVIAQLELLGYVGAGGSFGGAERSDIDAKTKQATIERLEEARVRQGRGDPAPEIEAIYREVLQQEPTLGEARVGLGRALERQGRMDEAIAEYRTALERTPDSVVVRTNLANALAATGHPDQGLAEMEKILALLPEDDAARVGVIKMSSDLGRYDEALSRASEWLAEDPRDATMQAHCGVLHARLGEWEAAEPLLRASMSDGVPRQLVHRSLGVLAMNMGRPKEAAEHYRVEAEHFPSDELRRDLADAQMRAEQWDEAAAEYAWLAEKHPKETDLRLAWAQAIFNTGDYESAAALLAPALAAAPDDPYVLLLHANILEKQGRGDEGAKVFARAKVLKAKREVP